MDKDKAIELYESGWWKNKTAREIVQFQLYEERQCMPIEEFQKALEEVLKRPVYTHEFADQKGLQAEFEGRREPELDPLKSLQRILHMLGRDDLMKNTFVIVAGDNEKDKPILRSG